MNIKDTVKHIAELAKLEFKDDELNQFSDQFGKIIEYINILNEIDLSKIEPLSQVTEFENVLRADEPKQSISLEEALKNAPRKNENFFKVPKVIDQE
jgi:aspartyl-tRNA(Asn)/glutamyl-tRNA(Gln) amidotransferase subunit C